MKLVNDCFDFLHFKAKSDGGASKFYKKDLNCLDLWNKKLVWPVYQLLQWFAPKLKTWILSPTEYKREGEYISEGENKKLIRILFKYNIIEDGKRLCNRVKTKLSSYWKSSRNVSQEIFYLIIPRYQELQLFGNF